MILYLLDRWKNYEMLQTMEVWYLGTSDPFLKRLNMNRGKGDHRLPRKLYKARSIGRWPRGKPRKTWGNNTQSSLGDRGIAWNQIRELRQRFLWTSSTPPEEKRKKLSKNKALSMMLSFLNVLLKLSRLIDIICTFCLIYNVTWDVYWTFLPPFFYS